MAPIKSWNAKHYILAALGGTLTATLIVIVVSVILSPARISFSVTHASRTNSTDGVQMNLTIAANNTSQRRAEVKYQSVFVDVKNSTNPAVGAGGTATIHAQLDTKLPKEYFQGGNVTSINASVHLVGGDWVQSFAGHWRNFTVVVTAQVRFRIGLARTRLFDIEVSCPGVLFPELANNIDEASSYASAVICK